MGRRGANTFFRFTLGFTLFIGLSLGIAFAVAEIETAQEKKRQTAAAFQVFLGEKPAEQWWTDIFK